MRDYATSLTVGLGVGVVYGLLRFRSTAPPLIALIGLLGMLIGEQAVVPLRGRGRSRSQGRRSESAPPVIMEGSKRGPPAQEP